MPVKVQQTQVIENWTDCWFGPTKRTGYVSVTDFESQKFYGAKDTKAIIRHTNGAEDLYISLNAFNFGSRRSEDLKQLRNIGIDIDQYKLGLDAEDALYVIDSLVSTNAIPQPNLVLKSHGVQLFYSIDQGAAPNLDWWYNYITTQLIDKLHSIGADPGAKGVTRVMRAPGSINSKNKSVVRSEIWNPYPYSLQDIQNYCKPFNKFSRHHKKKAEVQALPDLEEKRLKLMYQTNYARLTDLEKLIELRSGDFTHMRNNFIYVYAFHQSLIVNSLSHLERSVEYIFSQIHSRDQKKSFTQTELKRTIKSAYKDAEKFFSQYKADGYQIINRHLDGIKKPHKSETLIDMFDLSKDEERMMNTIYGEEIDKEKRAERKRKKRHEEGMKTREEYLYEYNSTKEKGVVLKNKGYKYKEIAEELNVSINTVKHWFRKKV